MRVTVCGHAALFIETGDQRLLVDPVFSDTLVGGALTFRPARAIDVASMPSPTALIITHGHFDHLDPDSLRMLPRALAVYTADDPVVVRSLRAAGFSNVHACPAWTRIELGRTRILTTPSEHEEPEFGMVVRDEGSAFWHMADAEAGPDVGRRIVRDEGAIGAVSVKYQPVVRASMGYLRGRGAAFDKRQVLGWLEAACACDPALVFPCASGLGFAGRHAWFNRYAFPLSADDVVRLLRRRLGGDERADNVLPGDVIELDAGIRPRILRQASDFVRAQDSPAVAWEPVDEATLEGLDDPAARQALRRRLESFLGGPLRSWIQRRVEAADPAWTSFRDGEVVWQLTVHVGGGERLRYYVDFRALDLAPRPGLHAEANFFSHVAGRGLFEVLERTKPGLLFWLAGEVRSFEKILGANEGGFWAFEPPGGPEDQPSDPMTYYLRHFGTGELSPNEPEMPGVPSAPARPATRAEDLRALAREGENDRVLGKKVLLAHLATKEAERLGLRIPPEEVQAVADSFRGEMELFDGDAMEAWLEDAGLSLETFSGVMQDFTTVLMLQKHHEDALASKLADHRRVIRARNRRLFPES